MNQHLLIFNRIHERSKSLAYRLIFLTAQFFCVHSSVLCYLRTLPRPALCSLCSLLSALYPVAFCFLRSAFCFLLSALCHSLPLIFALPSALCPLLSTLLSALCTNILSGIRTISAFTAEARVAERYERQLDAPYELGLKRAHVSGIGFGVAQLILFWCVYFSPTHTLPPNT